MLVINLIEQKIDRILSWICELIVDFTLFLHFILEFEWHPSGKKFFFIYCSGCGANEPKWAFRSLLTHY